MVEKSERSTDVVGNSVCGRRQILPEVRVRKYGRGALKAGHGGKTANEKLDAYMQRTERLR